MVHQSIKLIYGQLLCWRQKHETVIIQGTGTMNALVMNNSGTGLKRDGELNIGRKSGLSA